MESNKNQKKHTDKAADFIAKKSVKRRTLLKALIGVPVLGLFGYEVTKKRRYDTNKKSSLASELGLQNFEAPTIIIKSQKGDLLRIGIIGFGTRAVTHANALGYIHPRDSESRKVDGTLEDFLLQEDMNVALTGICDVFDLHAENGLATAHNPLRSGGAKAPSIPIKRFRTYQEMLEDKNIDAVMIATPDHHHSSITAAAAKAGKHVYCEKSLALNETELNEAYLAVKNSGIVFQLGHQITQSVVFQQAKDVIKKGILGKITLVETTTNRNSADGAWIRHLDANGNSKPGDEQSIDWLQWLGSTPYAPFSLNRYYNWQKFFAYETGLIGQLFTHEFDAVNQLLRIGIPKYVTSSGGIYCWKDDREMPDTLHCVFEYPNRALTLLYSATLANSRGRGRVFMGRDASMELGSSVNIIADSESEKYKKQIESGLIDPSMPMISFNPNLGKVDAVTSATEKYYANRGLTSTNINGRNIDITYLHVKEWVNCIRNGSTPSANMDMAFDESIACIMAHRSYLEHRRMEWDAINKKII